MSTILCIDDEPASGAVMEQAIQAIGCRPILVPSIEEGIRTLDRERVDLIISECRTRDRSALELLDHLRLECSAIPVIVTTGYASVENAVLMMQRGAADYLTKPLRAEGVRVAVRNLMEVGRLRRERVEILQEFAVERGPGRIIGSSPAILRLLERIEQVAPTRARVLVEGESGTGKELVARALHERSPRRDRPFVPVNCAALPDALVESMLFGHERGAFTGAQTRSSGAFERADGGTLLLDEVSEMRPDLQPKLLRAIQEQEFERVGGHQTIRVDVRIVATTNRDLVAEVAAGRFREDLYYRLSVVPIRTPALREHPEDIPALLEHLVEHHARRLGIRAPAIAPAVPAELSGRSWPGNVRELSNAVERALIIARGNPTLDLAAFEVEHVPARSHGPGDSSVPTVGDAIYDLRVLERMAIERALAATAGHRARAAHMLGISERTLRNKLNGVARDHS